MYCLGVGVNVIAERMVRKVFMTKLPERDAASTTAVIVERLKTECVKSVTADNGPENAELVQIASLLSSDFFFCHSIPLVGERDCGESQWHLRSYLPGKLICECGVKLILTKLPRTSILRP